MAKDKKFYKHSNDRIHFAISGTTLHVRVTELTYNALGWWDTSSTALYIVWYNYFPVWHVFFCTA